MGAVATAPVVVNVCAPETFPVRCVRRCPTCRVRRRFSGRDAAWYGPTWTCCACGDSFGDGQRLMRPARRGWRVAAAERARAVWREAGQYTKDQRRAWLKEQVGF